MYLSRVSLRPEIGATQLANLLEDRKGYGLHRLFWGLFSNGEANDQRRNFLFREELSVEQLSRPRKRKADPVYYVLSQEKPTDNALFEVDAKSYKPKLSTGDRLTFKLRVNAVVSRKGKRRRKNGKPITERHDIVMDAQTSWLKKQLKFISQSDEGKKGERKQRLIDFAPDEQLKLWRSEIKAGRYCQKLEEPLGRTALMDWAIKTAESDRVCEWWQRQGRENHGFEVARHPEYGYELLEHSSYRHHPMPEKGKKAGFCSIDLSGEIVVKNAELFTNLLLTGIGPAKAFGCGLMLVRRV